MSSGRGWQLTLILVGVLGAGASLGFAGVLPAELARPVARVCAGPLVLGLAAAPILALGSPVEPSLLKFGLLSGLLSPCWLALVYLLGRQLLAPDAALALAFGLTALCAPLARGRRIGVQPAGKAALATLLLTALLAALVGTLQAGLQAHDRLLQPGVVWHVGVTQAFARGLLENPWLAGTALPTQPGYGLLGFLFARSLALDEPVALAAVNLWALALVPIAVYLWAAPLWREPRRVLAAPVLALLGWNALGGCLPLGAVDGAPGQGATWAEWLARATPAAGPGEVLYGLASWLAPAPFVPALAFALGAWMCAAHALRHARRPWVGLAALLHAAAAAVDPVLGVAAMGATLFTALVAPGRPVVRPTLSLALAFSALPLLALVRGFSFRVQPALPLVEWPGPLALLLPAGLLLPMIAGLAFATPGPASASARWTSAEDRTLLLFTAAAAVMLLITPLTHLQNHLRTAELTRAASLPLAVLAAGGLFDWLDRRGWPRAVGVVLCALTAAGGARATLHVCTGFRALASSASGAPRAPGAADLARSYEWIRAAPELRGARAILVREVASGRGRIGDGFTPHPAALSTGLPMWCDLYPELSPNSARWEARSAQVQALFNQPGDWNPRIMDEWRRLRRPVVFVVEESDRRRTHVGDLDRPVRGVEARLLRVGARLARRVGEVAVYVLPAQGD